jgi:Kef-type K+ transport system membrane component KefB
MATIVVALMSILAIGFLGTWAASRLRLPHSVFLVILGVAAGMSMRGHAGATGISIGHLTGSLSGSRGVRAPPPADL